MLLAAMLGMASLASGRVATADPGSQGILWLPDRGSLPGPVPVVIALQDQTGIDSRGWHYAEHLTAAGIAVLHVELLEPLADGVGMTGTSDDAALARHRLTMLIDSLAQDPRFAGAPIGLLAFGDAGHTALRFTAGAALVNRIAGVVLLYPGCSAMAASERTEPSALQSPVLLLYGDTDPANLPADCAVLVERLSHSAPVQHRQHTGAGYAWDRVPYGLEEAVKLPWPGRPGEFVRVGFSPEAAQRAAAQVAAFFSVRLAAPLQ